MNILYNKHFFVGFMVSEIPRVSVFDYFLLRNWYYSTYIGYYLLLLLTT